MSTSTTVTATRAPAPSAVVARSTSDLERTVFAMTEAFEVTSAALEGALVTLQQRVVVRDGENAALQALNTRVNAEMVALRDANDALAAALRSANERADRLAASLAGIGAERSAEITRLQGERESAEGRAAGLAEEVAQLKAAARRAEGVAIAEWHRQVEQRREVRPTSWPNHDDMHPYASRVWLGELHKLSYAPRSPIGQMIDFSMDWGDCVLSGRGSVGRQGPDLCFTSAETLADVPSGVIIQTHLLPGSYVLKIRGWAPQGRVYLSVKGDTPESTLVCPRQRPETTTCLPTESDVVELEFTVPQAPLSTYRVEVLFRGLSNERRFYLSTLSLLPIRLLSLLPDESDFRDMRYLREPFGFVPSGHPATVIMSRLTSVVRPPLLIPAFAKSPTAFAANFMAGCRSGVQAKGTVTLSDPLAAGPLICTSRGGEGLSGIEREVRLVPGQRYRIEATGWTDEGVAASLYIGNGTIVPLPSERGTVSAEFTAPDEGTPFTTCSAGIRFEQGSPEGSRFFAESLKVYPSERLA